MSDLHQRRSTDHAISGFALIVRRFKLVQALLIAVVAVLVMFGFGFKTPAAHFRDIEATATIIDMRVQLLEQDRRAMQRYIRILVLAKCFELPRRQLEMLALPCDSLRRGQ